MIYEGPYSSVKVVDKEGPKLVKKKFLYKKYREMESVKGMY